MKLLQKLSVLFVALFLVLTSTHVVSAYDRTPGKLYREDERIYGDMLIDGDTQNTKVIETSRGATLTYSAKIDGRAVKAQYDEIYDNFVNGFGPAMGWSASDIKSLLNGGPTGARGAGIDISNGLSSTFTAVIEVPEHLDYTNATYALNTDWYTLEAPIVSGNTVTVTMRLDVAGKNIKTYADLDAFLVGDAQNLELTVSGVKVKDTAPYDTNITVVGSVTGTFTSVPQVSVYGNVRTWPQVTEAIQVFNARSPIPGFEDVVKEDAINFYWTGVQTQEGNDFILKDSGVFSIQATVIIPSPKGSLEVWYTVENADGTFIDIKDRLTKLTDTPYGTDFDVTSDKLQTIEVNGKVYDFVRTEGRETGTIDSVNEVVMFVYKLREEKPVDPKPTLPEDPKPVDPKPVDPKPTPTEEPKKPTLPDTGAEVVSIVPGVVALVAGVYLVSKKKEN